MSDYSSGLLNFFVRLFFYMQRGLGMLNEFRYVLMAVIAIYYSLRVDNVWLIPLMFIFSLPALVVFGWFAVHKMSKPLEYYSVEHATHWSRYNYTLLEQIRDNLKELNEKSKS